MSYIASLLLVALPRLAEAPLVHHQDALIPVADVIPDWKIEDKDKPERLYSFKKKEPHPLDWRVVGEKFTIVLDYHDPEKDQVMLHEKLADATQAIQRKVNNALSQFDGETTMLQWADKIYRQGWGDYDNYNGGFGTINDRRTGNVFCLFVHTKKQEEQLLTFVNTKTEAVFEISFHFALVALSDQKAPEWFKERNKTLI